MKTRLATRFKIARKRKKILKIETPQVPLDRVKMYYNDSKGLEKKGRMTGRYTTQVE